MPASVPRTGIHSVRVLDVAIIDVIGTAVIAAMISRKKFIEVFAILLVLSIFIHTILGIKTRTNAIFFNKVTINSD